MNAIFPKRCRCCGRTFELAEWLRLPLVAANYDVAGDGIDILTLRNCACNSTLSVPSATETDQH